MNHLKKKYLGFLAPVLTSILLLSACGTTLNPLAANTENTVQNLSSVIIDTSESTSPTAADSNTDSESSTSSESFSSRDLSGEYDET